MRALIFFAAALRLAAQQTIFDVPSADVAPRGDWFYQHQTVAKPGGPERRWIQSNAFGYGIGHTLELDATLYNFDLKRPSEAPFAFGAKWAPALTTGEAAVQVRLVLGQMVTVRPSAPKAGSWTYAMLSAESSRTRTRLTAGYTEGTASLFGRRSGSVLWGVEQRLSDRWMFQADYFGGHHDLSYLIPGAVYRFSTHWMVSAGYQIPNPHTGGFHAIVVELTRTP